MRRVRRSTASIVSLILAYPAVELHPGAESFEAGGQQGDESVDAGNCIHLADGQHQPLSGRGIGSHEGRWDRKAKRPGGFADAAAVR